MHVAELLLFECRPLNARISKEACKVTHGGKRGLQFNGELVSIVAGDPRGERVAVPTLYGSYGYV